MERTIFYIQHRIRTHIEHSPDADDHWRSRVEAERTLITRLDSCLKVLHFKKHMNLEKLANTTVHFGARSGIDLIGRIGLKLTGTDEEWVEQLFSVDLERIDAIKDGSADRYDLEKQLSELLGVAFVYTDHSLGGSERYNSFIKTLIELVSVSKFRLTDAECVKFRILDSTSKTALSTDVPSCTIALPIVMDPKEMLEQLEAQRKDLVDEFKKINRVQQELNALILAAKRKFRLRTLTWDPHVSTKQLQMAVTGLIRYSSQLFRMLEGQRVRIAFDYHLDESDGTINVRWDFMV